MRKKAAGNISSHFEAGKQVKAALVKGALSCSSRMVKDMPKNKGAAGNPGGQGAFIVRYQNDTTQIPTYAELGLDKKTATQILIKALITGPGPESSEPESKAMQPETGRINKHFIEAGRK